MIDINTLLNDTSKLSVQTLPELKELVNRYPFFQVARLLYVANLYNLHSKDFGHELRKASVFVPDRAALFALTEGINYQLPQFGQSSGNIETENDENRTISLIDSFLSGKREIEVEDNTPRNQPTIADLTNDYASYLVQQNEFEDENSQAAPVKGSATKKTPQLKGGELIDRFIETTKGKQRFEITETDDDNFISPEFSDEEEEIYTESMVNIYIKQKRFQQALEILRRISANNPKKSANFAAQINLLEIIISENNKK